jgi:uncharacterized protein YpuA (DUF1002 family)
MSTPVFLNANVGHIHLNTWGYLCIIKKLSNNDWKIIEEQIEKKLSSWKGKNLSVGCHLVLINSFLTSLVMFMLSFFEVPRGVLEKIDYYRS